jgi:hypothetical protein
MAANWSHRIRSTPRPQRLGAGGLHGFNMFNNDFYDLLALGLLAETSETHTTKRDLQFRTPGLPRFVIEAVHKDASVEMIAASPTPTAQAYVEKMEGSATRSAPFKRCAQRGRSCLRIWKPRKPMHPQTPALKTPWRLVRKP